MHPCRGLDHPITREESLIHEGPRDPGPLLASRVTDTPRRLTSSIAASVAAPASLYPLLPDLFQGLESLGSRPRSIVSLLRRAQIPTPPRILDLACGKGSVSLALARAFDARVMGIDACAPFIAHAAHRAASLHLADQTLFEVADVHAFLATRPNPRDRFDVTIMLNFLPATDAAPLLRRWTKPGGLYLVDDAILAPRPPRPPRTPRTEPTPAPTPAPTLAPTLAEVAASITRLGDSIVATRITPPAMYRQMHARLSATISRNITRLIPRHPSLAADLREYRRSQHASLDLLTGPLRAAMWLVRRE